MTPSEIQISSMPRSSKYDGRRRQEHPILSRVKSLPVRWSRELLATGISLPRLRGTRPLVERSGFSCAVPCRKCCLNRQFCLGTAILGECHQHGGRGAYRYCPDAPYVELTATAQRTPPLRGNPVLRSTPRPGFSCRNSLVTL